MKGIVKEAAKELAHAVFRVRNFQNKCLKEFAKGVRNKKILELGSGEAVDGRFIYSDKSKFHRSNIFIRSDISPEFGHLVVNVETMDFDGEFDIILCLNVLEHVYDFQSAIKNIHRSLKPGGILVLSTPYTYPLHMIPMDYWRFSAFALRKMLSDFRTLKLKRGGIKFLPSAYFVTAEK